MRKALVLTFGLALAAVAVMPAPASAQVQGLYYQEVEKDGRVYAFNTPEGFKIWSASGEMGKSITLIGAAEGGKTLVAENETAADLYFFKHNLPGYERPTPPPPKSVEDFITYKDGKLGFKFKAGEVSLSNRVQARFTEVDPPTGDSIGSFRLRRAKTTIEGKLYDHWKFKLQANWVGGNVVEAASLTTSGTTNTLSTTVGRGAVLEDAEIFYAKNPMATIWVGQGKSFFGRQELTSSGRQQFVDRSIASDRFAGLRQQGVGLMGVNASKTFEYNLGIYNGNGINRAANDNKDFLYIGRAVWTPLGEVKLEESSLDYPTTAKFALGLSALQNTTGTGTSETDVSRTGAEVVFKLKGLNAIGEYYQETSDPAQAGRPDVDVDGYYFQVGYLFPNQKFEIAGRSSGILPDTALSTDQIETGIAFSWYFAKHNHKLQADYREIETDRIVSGRSVSTTASEIRLQLQLIF
ncbi:MAG: porin [Thermoanaerobaculia bacterium]|nr:porin [Thermoanaerobaculia bacterium]